MCNFVNCLRLVSSRPLFGRRAEISCVTTRRTCVNGKYGNVCYRSFHVKVKGVLVAFFLHFLLGLNTILYLKVV